MPQTTSRFSVLTTDTVGTNHVIAHGLSSIPQIVTAIISGVATNGAPVEQTYQKSFGVCVQPHGGSLTQYCTGAHSDDGTSVTQADVSFRDDCIVCELAPGLNDTVTTGKLKIISIDATNVTFQVTEAFTKQAIVDTWIVAGDDLTWVDLRLYQGPITPGSISFTGLGFKPDVILFFGDHLSQAVPFVQPDSPTHMGVCDKNLNQWTWAGGENTNGGGGVGAGGRATSYMRGGKCLSIMNNNAANINTQGSVTSLDSDGFTINFDTINLDAGQTTGRRFAALCIQGAQWAAGNFTTFTDVSSHTIINTLPFEPDAVMFVSANKPASANVTVDLASENLSYGYVGAIGVNANWCHYVGQKGLPWTPSTVVYADHDGTLCYLNVSTAVARISTAAATLISGGFSWQHGIADVANNFVGYLAYATQPAAGSLTTVTKTVKPAGGGDYTSLDAALAGELAAHKNMRTQNIILEFDCYAGIDRTPVSHLTGWNNPGGKGYITGPNNYILIKAVDGHVGRIVSDGTKYLLDINGNGGVLGLLVQNEYVRFKQLQLRLTVSDGGTSAGGYFIASSGMQAPTHWEFINCIEQHVLSNGSQAECFHPPAAAFDVAGVTTIYVNCVAYDVLSRDSTDTAFNAANGVNQTLIRYNCTAINCAVGFQDRPFVVDKNNVAIGCDNGWNTGAGAPNAASDFNFSTCGPSGLNGNYYPGTLSSGALDAKGNNSNNGLPVFLVDPLNGDFRPLQGVDTQLIGTGTDLSADATYPFNFDVTGATRSGLWSRGAWHIPSVAPVQGWKWAWAGGVTSIRGTIVCRYNLTGTIKLQLDTSAAFSNPTVYTATADQNGVAQFPVTLLPNTNYFYRTFDNSLPGVFSPVGQFRSFPFEGQPASFTVICGGCSDTGSNTNLYTTIKNIQPLLYISYGDIHYWNIITADQSLYRLGVDCVHSAPKRMDMFHHVAMDCVWDDHDYGKDNSDSTSAAKQVAQVAFRECFPTYTLPATSLVPLSQASTIIFVKPVTRYDAKRGHVAFYNWANLTNVPVDLSSILNNGDTYSVYDIRDLVNPVLTGTYAGGTVNFPTTQKSDPTPVGGFVSTPVATAPFFNAFLVVGNTTSSFTYDFYVSPTGGTGAGTITDPWSLSYAAGGAGGAIVPGKHIALRGGTYDTGTSTLSFGSAVSGSVGIGPDDQGSKVIFRAYQNEKPVILNRANSSGSGDAVHFGCDYTWFWNIEWYDNGWSSRDVVPVFNDGLTVQASHGNGVKLIHNIIHDFESAGIGTFDGAVNSDKFDAYGCIIYNQGVNRNQQGHNLYLHHAGAVGATWNIDTCVIFNSFGLNCQYYSDSDHTDFGNFLNSIWFGAGALMGAPGGTQYQQASLLLGGNTFSSNNCIVTNNLFHSTSAGVALLKVGFNNTKPQSFIEVGNNYGVGGGAASGSFSTFAINSPVVPQSSLNVHDNLWECVNANSLLFIKDTGTLNYNWQRNEWHHDSGSGFDGTSYATFQANTGLGATDTQFNGDPGIPIFFPAGPIYHSFVIGRCRFIMTDLRSNRTPNSAVDDVNKTMMGQTQLNWFFNELTTAQQLGQFIFWFSTVPWIAPVGDNNSDDWGGFTNERAEIANFVAANRLGNQMIICCGDMHSAAIDDGTHDRYAAQGGNNTVVFLPFPENQTTQIYGGSYTQGPITHVGTRLMGFAGRIDVTDTGGPLQITLSVINELGTQLTFTKQFTIPTPQIFSQSGGNFGIPNEADTNVVMDRRIERYRLTRK